MGGIDDINGRYVDFDDRPSNGYGLVTEASEAGTPATKDEIKTSRQSGVIQLNEGDSIIIRGSDAKSEAALRLFRKFEIKLILNFLNVSSGLSIIISLNFSKSQR